VRNAATGQAGFLVEKGFSNEYASLICLCNMWKLKDICWLTLL